MSRKTNPRRKPATQADVKRAKDKATSDACRACMSIFFTVLLDKERADKETLQRVWGEVESLSDSVAKGYASISDLMRVLREEYEIRI